MGPDHADEMTAIRLELVELEGSSDDLQIRSQAPWMALMRFIEGGTDRRALRMVDESYGRLVHELPMILAMRWSLGVFRTIVALNDGRPTPKR